MPKLFFSYARADEEGLSLVREFFDELSAEVRGLIGGDFPEDETAFFDQRDIRLGEEWEERLKNSLQTAKVLVCLFSPTYFTRFYCGKEMAVFEKRRVDFAKKQNLPSLPSVILPVIWYPFGDRMPKSVIEMNLQLHEANYPPAYKQEGLKHLKSLIKHQDDYSELKRKLALRIQESLKVDLPPLVSPLAIKDVTSLF